MYKYTRDLAAIASKRHTAPSIPDQYQQSMISTLEIGRPSIKEKGVCVCVSASTDVYLCVLCTCLCLQRIKVKDTERKGSDVTIFPLAAGFSRCTFI